MVSQSSGRTKTTCTQTDSLQSWKWLVSDYICTNCISVRGTRSLTVMAEAPSVTNNWSYATFAAAFDVAHQSLVECVASIVVADILSVVLRYAQIIILTL